ncbi:TetR/AcrR family transcriptional regulator [Streptomyces sp. NPDC005438]|uniref:TetR/AcrR family transcriptional regulator n=1 Tax=Streptomyces sp. NPDC005438 TaxID=3156880 RepID=UPI0033B35392
MARVSQEHLDARRRQILDGARRCFARNGFHATSMQDVLGEVGLSAGAVYRYFRGKDEIVTAVAAEALAAVRDAYNELTAEDRLPLPDEIFVGVLERVRGTFEGADDRTLPQLLLQVWGEALRNPELAEVMREAYQDLLGRWRRLVEDYQERGWLDPEASAEEVARTLVATVQGYFVQQALFGGLGPEDFRRGMRGLLTLNPVEEGDGSAGPAGS